MATQSDGPPSSSNDNPLNTGSQVEPEKESSPTSVFVNPEPIREDQVQNAVKFLSHPKVKGSPVVYRRSFLERKGLTKEEIDEAFRRIPDETPAVQTTQPAVPNQDGKMKSSIVQQQHPTQGLQSPPASVSKTRMLSRFRWYHALLAVGFLTASGAGAAILFKNAILPRFKAWIRKSVWEDDEEGLVKEKNTKPSVAEEAAAAAKAAAVAASDVARASQEMLTTKNEEKRCFEELISVLNVQLREMKSMSSAIQKLEVGQSYGRISAGDPDYQRFSGMNSRQRYANGRADTDSRSVRSLSPPAPVEPSVAPPPKSYMEMMAMIQNGENPFNIRDANDAPPNPNQQVSNPHLAPKPQSWEANQVQNNTTYPTQPTTNGVNYTYSDDNQMNGDDTIPWWQRKNVRITEVESPEVQKFGSSNASMNIERPPVQRSSSWVPPQPPPVAMPEAAAAIRQPKKSFYQTEPLTDEQLLARSGDLTDELQKATRMAESGGSYESKSEGSEPERAEIQQQE